MVVDGQTALTTALYDRLRTGQGNLFFSPYSIDTALMMVYAGAAGTTAAEMATVLHLPNAMGPAELHQTLGELVARLQRVDKDSGYQLHVANALWAQSGVHWMPRYLDLLQRDYAAEAFTPDFAQPETARRSINDWVAQQTNQKITDLLPPGSISSATRLVLTDAVYFKADWAAPFRAQATHDGDFHVNAGSTVSVPMMHQMGSFAFMEDQEIQALQMPYSGGDWAMLLILPRTIDGLGAVEAKLNPAELGRIVGALADQSVQVSLPKFQLSQSFSLGGVLKGMGMTRAFDPRSADFSGMDGERDLCLSDVLHKAYVAVDEQGTEAAAATGGVIVATAVMRPQRIFDADHPFMFFLRDLHSGVILFAGRCSEPAQGPQNPPPR
jgi:serpin B